MWLCMRFETIKRPCEFTPTTHLQMIFHQKELNSTWVNSVLNILVHVVCGNSWYSSLFICTKSIPLKLVNLNVYPLLDHLLLVIDNERKLTYFSLYTKRQSKLLKKYNMGRNFARKNNKEFEKFKNC